MSYDKHVEKEYPQDVQRVFAAALKAVETLEGKIDSQSTENSQLETKFPKTILKNTLGNRTHLTCTVRTQGDGSQVVVDAYPLDALERKLMFGARKGVTQKVVDWYVAHLEHHLGKGE
jgi:hypothetical protein